MRYELLTIRHKIGAAGPVLEALGRHFQGAAAQNLLGCWNVEIGELNQILLLRSFPDPAAAAAERHRLHLDPNLFGCGEHIVSFAADGYALFPFATAPKPGKYGAIYEMRSYRLRPGGLAGVLASWAPAVPERVKRSPMSALMHTTDGEPRITHFWPYPTLEARIATRTQSVKDGIWPPKDGPSHLLDMRSTLLIPTAFSPMA